MTEPIPKRCKTAETNDMPTGHALPKGTKRAVVMMNQIVLTEIASCLPAVDLLALRDTCATWNLVLLPQLRGKHRPIKLTAQNLGEFVQVMKSSASIPFSSYEIGKIRTGLDEFVSVCGVTVTKLVIEIEWFARGSEAPIGVLQAIFGPRMNNLTELELSFSDSRLPFEHEGSESGEIRATMRIPKLKRFQFTSTDVSQPPWARVYMMANLIHAFVTGTDLGSLQFPGHEWHQWGFHYLAQFLTYAKHTNGNIASLRHLGVRKLTLPVLRLLLELAERKENCLRLQTFSYGESDWMRRGSEADEGSAEKKRIWTTLLALLAPHLLELTVMLDDQTDQSIAIPIWLPRMERLRTLTITTSGSEHEPRNFALEYRQDTFAETFPGLKKLSYYFWCQAGAGQDDSPEMAGRGRGFGLHAGLTELCLIHAAQETVSPFPTIFPSVTRLDLTLSASDSEAALVGEPAAVYASIWTSWPVLRSLNLKAYLGPGAGVTTEELLTGVPSQQLPGLRKDLDALIKHSHSRPFALEDFASLSQKYKTRPGISDLRRLESFTLEWDNDPELNEWSQFTEPCVYSGIALTGPQLQEIKVKCLGNGVARVSDDCLQFLRSVVGTSTLIDIN